jgi:sec-independent protein translocase protein TatC
MARRGVLGVRRVRPDEELSVVEHLDELRRRIILSVVALVVAFGVAYAFYQQLFDFLAEPLPGDNRQLVTLSPTEGLFTVLKVCFWAALLAALPVWLYQLYAFVIPAVAEQPRRKMLVIVAGLSILFIGGAAFGFFVVLPVALSFLLGFGGDLFTNDLRAGEYYGFVTSLMFGTGLMFEVPIAMLAFARLGVVTARTYVRQWRIALVVIAVIAALLPGGDPVSMLLLMAPQIALYALGVWLAKMFGQPPAWRRDLWADDSQAAPDPGAPSPG